MLTDLQWRYAKHQRDVEEQYRYGYCAYLDPMENRYAAFEDMEQIQLEQDMYDEFENPACTYGESFEAHQYHHELPEPVPRHQLDVERIIELLEA